MGMGDDDIDLLAEICDDPDDEDSDYGRGWQDGYRARQATPDGPRRWQLPAEPGPEVTAVRDARGDLWNRQRRGGWRLDRPMGALWSWATLIRQEGPLTDVTPAADGQGGRDG
jgi:hypothetical protein